MIPAKLTSILKSKVKGATASTLEVDDLLKGVSILVPHGRMKCQISVYPALELDALKSNVDPASADLKFESKSTGAFEVEATLMGCSTDVSENVGVHFDGSKALTIFRQAGVTNMASQVKLLEEFRALEANLAAKTSTLKNSSPSANDGGRR